MAVDPIWFMIEQITRILQGLGWTVVATDTSGPMARITAEKPKPRTTGG